MKAIFSSFITSRSLSLPTRHLHLFFCACAKAVQTSTRSFQISFFPSVTLSLSPPPCCVLHLATPGGRYISSERWSVTTAHQDVKTQAEGVWRKEGRREGWFQEWQPISDQSVHSFNGGRCCLWCQMSERLNECVPPSRHYVADLPLFPASLPESRQGGLVILKSFCRARSSFSAKIYHESYLHPKTCSDSHITNYIIIYIICIRRR